MVANGKIVFRKGTTILYYKRSIIFAVMSAYEVSKFRYNFLLFPTLYGNFKIIGKGIIHILFPIRNKFLKQDKYYI